MKKLFLFLLFSVIAAAGLSAQLVVSKMLGKNSDKYKLGYGVFSFLDFPLNQDGNRSIRVELMDFAYFPGKEDNTIFNTSMGRTVATISKGYISIKLGYKYIFSESRTGFYVEPSAGFARVVDATDDESTTTHGDGLALAFETGYSLEVGQRGHVLNFGVKYENDRAGTTISSVGFRVSYAFNMFARKSDY